MAKSLRKGRISDSDPDIYHKLDVRLDPEDLFARLRLNFPEQDS